MHLALPCLKPAEEAQLRPLPYACPVLEVDFALALQHVPLHRRHVHRRGERIDEVGQFGLLGALAPHDAQQCAQPPPATHKLYLFPHLVCAP
eukprot:6151813-Prymnesium_polylepis.2